MNVLTCSILSSNATEFWKKIEKEIDTYSKKSFAFGDVTWRRRVHSNLNFKIYFTMAYGFHVWNIKEVETQTSDGGHIRKNLMVIIRNYSYVKTKESQRYLSIFVLSRSVSTFRIWKFKIKRKETNLFHFFSLLLSYLCV